MKRNSVLFAFLGAALLLCLPVFASWASETIADGRFWPLADEGLSCFSGTLENRIEALNAFGNASPHIRQGEKTALPGRENLWRELAAAGLIPDDLSFEDIETQSCVLTPAQGGARFEYAQTTARGEGICLAVTQDELSGIVMRIELSGARAALGAWEDSRYPYRLLRRYVSHLGYDSDIDYLSSCAEDGSLFVDSALIPETYLEAAVTVAREAGIIVYQLSLAGIV